MKRYNTPHRRRVIKTRLTEEEYAEFSERVTLCKMSQAEFIRQALIKSSIRPVITVSPVNDELPSAVGKLTAEYGKIGGNLNQIARCLNEYGAPYNVLSQEVRAATTELAALKSEVLQKVGEAVGNIHVHIVINSLRIAEVPLLPYMERPADTREGCKHRCTDAAMEYFKAEVMEMCHLENLYQIDLLHGSKNRVTEREYWAKRKGQAALDKENVSIAAKGEPPRQTKFETNKEKLRCAIRAALSSAISFEDFFGKLLQ